jgi:hypothetical protein
MIHLAWPGITSFLFSLSIMLKQSQTQLLSQSQFLSSDECCYVIFNPGGAGRKNLWKLSDVFSISYKVNGLGSEDGVKLQSKLPPDPEQNLL